MAAVSGFDDPFLPLAFSLYSSPGAYAVIAGAGVSVGAGVSTAWDVVVKVAQQSCRALGGDASPINAQTVEDWYAATFSEELTYSGILERVAPTMNERERVLGEFFESIPDPSKGHRAIARLAKHGVIRVVVTMNFDHLFEAALREVGIEPRIVATEAAADGLPPLHTISECLVVHLHGSYRDGTSMLNTSTELDAYSPNRQALLNTIVSTHGLLIAGWSAQHDRALRETLYGKHRKFFTPAWINPSAPRNDAQSVAIALGAHVIEATADEAFTRFADAVDAMTTRQTRHPLTVAVVVDRIKQDLAGHHPAITAHDTFSAEATRLESVDALLNIDHATIDDAEIDTREMAIDEACLVPAAATAVLARWGQEDTDEWWWSVLEQWSIATPSIGGRTRLDELPLIVATNLFYAAGIAALASRRYQLLARLLAHTIETPYRKAHRACLYLAWDTRHASIERTVTNPMREKLAATLTDSLSLSTAQIDLLWQQFETLVTAAQIASSPAAHQRVNAVITTESLVTDRMRMESIGQNFVNGPTLVDLITDADEAMANLARLSERLSPHVEVELLNRPSKLDDWRLVSRVAERLAQDASDGVLNAIAATAHNETMPSGIAPPHSFALTVLCSTQAAFRATAHNIASGRTLNHLWLDAPASP